ADDAAHAGVVSRLEDELEQTRNVLRNTVEQYETSNEELRAPNEELQALNEELRSATEELETSKEALQSLNEELHTVNLELKERIEELGRTNADLANLLSATEIGTVFLDRELNIARYTPHFANLFNVIPADVGRPFAHLTHHLDYNELPQDAARVLRRLAPVEREVRSHEGQWYAARALPYRTEDDHVAGVVIAFIDITARKLAELVLTERDAQLQLAARAARAGFWGLELATGVGTVSEGWRDVMGFTPEGVARGLDALFRTVLDEDRARLEEAIEGARGGAAEFGVELSIQHPERGQRRIQAQARVLPTPGANPRLQGVVIDITEMAAAAETQARLASIVELSGDAVISFDLDHRILSWNGGAEQLLGYTAAEAVGQDLSLIIPPDRADEADRAFEKFRRGERVGRLETVRRAKDGRLVEVSFTASPVLDADGRPVGGAAILRDISEQRAAQSQLRSSELQLRRILESVEDYAIFTLDLEGRVTRWNRGAQNTFGFTAEEIVGENTAIIFTPEDRERGAHLQEMETALAEGRAEDERWHLRKDGSRFYASGVLTPLRDGDDVRGFVKVARDLTERRRAEQERAGLAAQLEEERATLERRVEERTSALFMEVAERRAAEEHIKELVSRIVETQEQERRRISRDLHDILGQQLTALRLNLEAIKEGCVEMDASLLVQVEQAQAAAGRLDAEVDFMAWELRPAALDEVGLAAALENFVHEWSAHFHVTAEYHSAGLSKRRLAPDLETNLYRIAQEALNNIAKHSGAQRVGVILERRDRYVALIVEDDGRGFDPAEASDGERGMGLLNMSERAALAGGTLEIESAPGEGTTVFARVPARFAERK
nr:PAS domain S-box protein [Acidobacteriota bacterium]